MMLFPGTWSCVVFFVVLAIFSPLSLYSNVSSYIFLLIITLWWHYFILQNSILWYCSTDNIYCNDSYIFYKMKSKLVYPTISHITSVIKGTVCIIKEQFVKAKWRLVSTCVKHEISQLYIESIKFSHEWLLQLVVKLSFYFNNNMKVSCLCLLLSCLNTSQGLKILYLKL